MLEQKPADKGDTQSPKTNTAADTSDKMGVLEYLGSSAMDFIRSERSGLDFNAATNNLLNTTFGELIAPGLYVAHTGSTAQFHLIDTPLQQTMKDFAKSQEAFLCCIQANELVEGISPSLKALRVLTLLFQSMPGFTAEDRGQIKALRKEAADIDLTKPTDTDWKRTISVMLDSNPLEISLQLQKVDSFSKLGTALLGMDIPAEYRASNYCYALSIRSGNPTKTDALRSLQHRGSQLFAATCLSTPMAAVFFASAAVLPQTMLPTFTSNPGLQSLAETAVHLAPAFAAGVATFLGLRHFQKQRT